MPHQGEKTPNRAVIYISDSRRTGIERLKEVAVRAAAAGLSALILRERTLDSGRLLALAAELRALTRPHDCRLIVHSAADVARAVDADGVHLAAAGMEEARAIRRWWGVPGKTISVSCHDADQLRRAAEVGADFALLSPLFATASHPQRPPLGVERWRALATAAPLPVVALGGITPANRAVLADWPVALMRGLDEAESVEEALYTLLLRHDSG
ncbi:MAG: thiamine phosphate synthase [Zetaproteobacteria bacterium]|nr:MAG: thiamine phosphate synthase [Zetaproteobacteria bacterium]